MIEIQNNIFHLQGEDYSYVLQVQNERLEHVYYGARVSRVPQNTAVLPTSRALYEYPAFGKGDFRVPAISIATEGSSVVELKYSSHRILSENPHTPFSVARDVKETLEILLTDEVQRIKVALYYSPLQRGILRSAVFFNEGDKSVRLLKFASLCLDLPSDDYEVIDLDGRPNKERQYNRMPLPSGIHTVSSNRGVTSHQHCPFYAVAQKETTEDEGGVYALNVLYSGNFLIECERDEYAQARLNGGISLPCGIEVKAKESFASPEVILTYSHEGIGQISRNFHQFYRRHIIAPRFVGKPRPIVINSWECMVFSVCEEKLIEFVEKSAGLGIDTVVLDDGWFVERNNDDRALGDWDIDEKKFPNGFQPIVDRCAKHGMKMGIWFEPEAISPESSLYRAHPEWAIASAGREPTLIRNQMVLNFANPRAVDYIFGKMAAILDKYDIDYVKWDMNRSLTDVDENELYPKFVRGVYDLYERLAARYPNLIIEGCSSGGGRFDGGILQYSPFIWTSDNTDAYERCKIQYSTSLCYPLETMSNHISDCPNIQMNRTSPLDTRLAVASLGCLGFEMHAERLSEKDREKISTFVARYKEDRDLILNGDLYRVKNPFTDGAFAELVVSEDKTRAYFVYVKESSLCAAVKPKKVRFKGLDENKEYEIEEYGTIYSGGYLTREGIVPEIERGDYRSVVLHLRAIDCP